VAPTAVGFDEKSDFLCFHDIQWPISGRSSMPEPRINRRFVTGIPAGRAMRPFPPHPKA
jgi:hypothetical protein